MTIWLILLTIAVAALAVRWVYTAWNARQHSTTAGQENGVRLRINVLLLLLFAYASLGGLFAGMVLAGLDVQQAYDNISVPFVALIGGTLAVVKDLI